LGAGFGRRFWAPALGAGFGRHAGETIASFNDNECASCFKKRKAGFRQNLKEVIRR
jgi:hypothetical protein